jgi:hypothetical protein
MSDRQFGISAVRAAICLHTLFYLRPWAEVEETSPTVKREDFSAKHMIHLHLWQIHLKRISKYPISFLRPLFLLRDWNVDNA